MEDNIKVETIRNRSRKVKAEMSRQLAEAVASKSIVSSGPASYHVQYQAGDQTFVVVVYERKRWYIEGDHDGLDVLSYGDDGKLHHFTNIRMSDLPAKVRTVVRDVLAAMNYKDTTADKARKARRDREHREWLERMARDLKCEPTEEAVRTALREQHRQLQEYLKDHP